MSLVFSLLYFLLLFTQVIKMKSNLERFQMTKLSPFKEKIQRQYLSTNVSPPIQRRSVCIFQVAPGSNFLNFPPAHRTFGGDAADGL